MIIVVFALEETALSSEEKLKKAKTESEALSKKLKTIEKEVAKTSKK